MRATYGRERCGLRPGSVRVQISMWNYPGCCAAARASFQEGLAAARASFQEGLAVIVIVGR